MHEFTDVLYHFSFLWLNSGKILKRMCNLKEEILMFLDVKDKDVIFPPKAGKLTWHSWLKF
jgi:hypothetical protein